MIQALKQLALMNAMKKMIKVSSKEFAEKIEQSLQTAARKLKELEDAGFIERIITKDGQYIIITEEGKKLLYREYLEYKKIFDGEERHLILKGRVISGIGEGRYYVSLPQYKRQFIKLLGFIPFHGTLNVKLSKEQGVIRRRLEEEEGIRISGFVTETRTFGDVKAFKCRINGIEGAIIIPQRTHYDKSIVEVIAPVKLRDVLKLEDGDEVEIEVML